MDGSTVAGCYRRKYRVGQLICIKTLGSESRVEVWSEPAFKYSSAIPVGKIDPGEICLVLEVCFYSYKILSKSGMVGWVDWVDVYDPLEAS